VLFQAGVYLPGQPITFEIEFELYPDPKPGTVVWAVNGGDDKPVEYKPGSSSTIEILTAKPT
jgi:hypothetical protein